jgi:hypothetical protein
MFIHVYFFCRYMFRPLLAIFKRNTQLFLEVISPTVDALFCVLCIIRHVKHDLLKYIVALQHTEQRIRYRRNNFQK